MKFINLRFERWQVLGLRKQEEGKRFHKLYVLGMDNAL